MRTALIVGGVAVAAAAGGWWWWSRRARTADGDLLVASRYNSIDRSPASNFTEPYPVSSPPNNLVIAAQQAARWAEDAPPPPPAADCGPGYHWDPGGASGFGFCVADPQPDPPAGQPAVAKPKKKSFLQSIGSGIVDVGKAAVGVAVKVEKVQYDQFKKGAALVGADKKIPGYDAGTQKIDGVIRGAA